MTLQTGDSADGREARPLPDLVSRSYVIEQLLRELFDETQPSGASLLVHKDEQERAIARDLGYRKGWNDRARSLARLLEQGRTMAALRELRDAVPTVTEAVSVFVGEGG